MIRPLVLREEKRREEKTGKFGSCVNVLCVRIVRLNMREKNSLVRVEVLDVEAPDLQRVYQEEFASLVSLARLLVGDDELAQELVQDAFARLLERPPRLDSPQALPSYVRSTVLNACRSRIRRFAVERKYAKPDPTTTTDVAADHELRAALLELPIRQRQCVALRYYEDRTVNDIATLLGIGEGSVKTHLHRGLARLKDTLKENS